MFQARRAVPPTGHPTHMAAAAAAAAPIIPAEPEPAEPPAPISALAALPRLLHVHPELPDDIDYHVSSDDMLAAIREGKETFIALVLNNDSPPVGGLSREERLWEQANELAFQRLKAHLEHTIRERQRKIIVDYATTLSASTTPVINIDFLNTSLVITTSEGEPIYAAFAEDIYIRYVNQFLTHAQEGGRVRYGDDFLLAADLPARVRADLGAFLQACRDRLRLQYRRDLPIHLQAEVERLAGLASRALTKHREASRRYTEVMTVIEEQGRVLVSKRQTLHRFAEGFARLAPSTFIRALNELGIRPGGADFERQLASIFLSSTVGPLPYLHQAVESGTAEIVELLARECVKRDIDPLQCEEGDAAGESLLHIIAAVALRAPTANDLGLVLAKLRSVLDAAYDRLYASAHETTTDPALCARAAAQGLLAGFLLKNSEHKTALDVLLDVDKLGMLLALREYITPERVSHSLSAGASEFHRRVHEHLASYDRRLSLLESSSDVSSLLNTRVKQFDYPATPTAPAAPTAAAADDPCNRLIQRRKALETLWLSLWLANVTRLNASFTDRLTKCIVSGRAYTEPGAMAILSRTDALTTPLVELVGAYTTGTIGRDYTAVEIAPPRGGAGAPVDIHPHPSFHGSVYRSRSVDYLPTDEIIETELRHMELAIEIQNLFLSSIDTNTGDFSLSELDGSKKHLHGLARDIYDKVLNSYRRSTSGYYSFLFSHRSFSTEKWSLQRKYMSRMADALGRIARYAQAGGETNVDQERVITAYLLQQLGAMAAALPWIKPAVAMYIQKTHRMEQILEINGDRVRILPSIMVANVTIERLMAEFEAARAADRLEADRLRAADRVEIEERFSRMMDERLARLEGRTGGGAPSAAGGLSAHGVFSSRGGGRSPGLELTSPAGVRASGSEVAHASAASAGAGSLGSGSLGGGARGGAGAGAGAGGFNFSRR